MMDTKAKVVDLARKGWDGDAISALLNISIEDVRHALNNPRFPAFGGHLATFDGRHWNGRGRHA